MASKAKTKKNAEAKKDVASPYSPAQIKKFVKEVQVEFSKIVWPDRKITLGMTGIVVVLAIAMGLYLGAVDQILGRIVSLVLR